MIHLLPLTHDMKMSMFFHYLSWKYLYWFSYMHAWNITLGTRQSILTKLTVNKLRHELTSVLLNSFSGMIWWPHFLNFWYWTWRYEESFKNLPSLITAIWLKYESFPSLAKLFYMYLPSLQIGIIISPSALWTKTHVYYA